MTIIIPKMPDENFQMSFIPKKYLVTRAIFYPHTHSPTKAYNGTDWIDEIEARKRVLASRLLKKDHTNERDVNSATPCAMTKLKIINADNNRAEEHIITSVVSSVISFNRIGSFSEEEKLSRRKKNNSYLVCAGAMMMMMQPNNARVSTTCSEKSTRWVHSERVACDCAADYFGRLLLVKNALHTHEHFMSWALSRQACRRNVSEFMEFKRTRTVSYLVFILVKLTLKNIKKTYYLSPLELSPHFITQCCLLYFTRSDTIMIYPAYILFKVLSPAGCDKRATLELSSLSRMTWIESIHTDTFTQ